MRKTMKKGIIFLVVISILISTYWFLIYPNFYYSKDTFGIEQFKNALKVKNYNFEIKDAEKDFLPTTRKRIIIGNEALDIYLFTNTKKMEHEANYIDSNGCGYSNGSRSINVSWVSLPHFYKRGSIIVQYVGENEKIISGLNSILGEQFAGFK